MRILAAFGSLLALGIGIAAQAFLPEPPAVKRPFAESLQAVVVTTPDWPTVKGTARLFERKTLRAKWTAVGDEFPIVVGRSGLGWAIESAPESAKDFKKEGDGKAPAGLFPLTFAFGSAPKPEQLGYPYTKLESSTECVDDAASTHYNKIVDRFKVGIFDWKSSEKMLAVGEEYALGVFVAYNSYPVRRGDGSCIFLHVWKDAETPTSGCTAMERRNVERIVSWLDTARNPYLVQLPAAEYKKLRKKWNLPKLR
jgi:L,D-peptidoglycan transpeptidase YkuD (ErfK/YbiS/YcfS/YnhG family)